MEIASNFFVKFFTRFGHCFPKENYCDGGTLIYQELLWFSMVVSQILSQKRRPRSRNQRLNSAINHQLRTGTTLWTKFCSSKYYQNIIIFLNGVEIKVTIEFFSVALSTKYLLSKIFYFIHLQLIIHLIKVKILDKRKEITYPPNFSTISILEQKQKLGLPAKHLSLNQIILLSRKQRAKPNINCLFSQTNNATFGFLNLEMETTKKIGNFHFYHMGCKGPNATK